MSDIIHFIIASLNLKPDQIKSLDTVKKDGTLFVKIQLVPSYPECDWCGGPVKIKEYKTLHIRHSPVAGTPCTIVWKRTRYVCKDCGKTFSELNPFGPDGFNQSFTVLESIAKALHNPNNTVKQIACDHNVSSTLVQAYADSFIHVPRITLPVNLGIDEIHSDMAKYGGSYLCVFVDNERRYVAEILPDRSMRTLSRYLDNIPMEERNRVRYVTIDMWKSYRDTAYRYFRNARVSVDPFHVIKHLTDCFESLRKSIMKQAPEDSPVYYLLKHWHKLLLSDYNLDNKPRYNSYFKRRMNYRDLYEMILAISPQLREAYELKELYRSFNRSCSFENAQAMFETVLQAFEESNLPCYEEFVKTIKNWRTEIINSFERPYENRKQSNALCESFNQKLRILINVSYGFANFDRFRARALYCLNDAVFYSITSNLKRTNKREGRKRGPYKKVRPLLVKEPDPYEFDGPEDSEKVSDA